MEQMKKYTCKYCGLSRGSLIGKAQHEISCPEFRYFAEWILKYVGLIDNNSGVVFGFETHDKRITEIVKRYKELQT